MSAAKIRGFCEFGVAFCSCLISACGTDDEQVRFHTFTNECWMRTESLILPVDSINESGVYDLTLLLRAPSGQSPAYETIGLNVREQGLKLSPVLNDTLFLSFCDEEIRKGRNGVSYHPVEAPVGHIMLKKGDCGHLIVSHVMSVDSLIGISEVGYRLVRIRQ